MISHDHLNDARTRHKLSLLSLSWTDHKKSPRGSGASSTSYQGITMQKCSRMLLSVAFQINAIKSKQKNWWDQKRVESPEEDKAGHRVFDLYQHLLSTQSTPKTLTTLFRSKTSNGHYEGIHIADVSYYVPFWHGA